ncbi:MAG: SEC-C metal-binding domain-containing protein, partial [bacterium]
VREEIIGMIFKVQIVEPGEVPKSQVKSVSYGPPQKSAAKPAPVKSKIKVGRNDPCPCGSGKKYKKCCLSREKSRGMLKEEG